MLKTNESSKTVQYAFSNPPGRIIGHVTIYKLDGWIELNNGKQKRVKRPVKIDGMDENEFHKKKC